MEPSTGKDEPSATGPDLPGFARTRPDGDPDRVTVPYLPPTTPPVQQGTTPDAPPRPFPALSPPGTVGRYVLLEEVARGGMGIVYKARDTVLGRLVALKMIQSGVLAGPEEVERFHREARAVVHLDHPHVIQVYDFGEAEGCPYFTMRFVGGGSLAEHQQRFRADSAGCAALVEKVARAVHHAHGRGVLHRDLKPANILLADADEPLVTDFGLAKVLDTGVELTQAGQAPGTPAYMAPEQALGHNDQVSPRTDVWALGIILYELLTGKRPFTGRGREEMLHRILTTEPPPPRTYRADLDPALEAIVLKCLKKEAAQRYPSAGALADDLGRWLRHEPTEVQPPQRTPRLPSLVRRRPLVSLALALCGVAALALVAALRFRGPEQGPETPAVTLIGEGGLTQDFHWVAGQKDSEAVPAEDGAFSVRTADLALLELLSAPPWPSYRLEAEVRHDAGTESVAGIYFAHARYNTAPGVQDLSCRLAFADLGPGAGWVKLSAWCCQESRPAMTRYRTLGAANPFTPSTRLPGPRPWRQLAVEVTPETVRAYWEGQCIVYLSPQDVEQHNAGVLEGIPGVPWGLTYPGGLGLYVRGGTASFRQMVVKRLP